MLDARQLEALAAVVEHGGFGPAARALSLTLAAVSLRIKSLEDALGQRLLVRGRQVRATPAGQALLGHVKQVRLMEADLLAGLQDAQGVMHAMTGIFPFSAKMHPRFQALGYRQVTLTSDCLLGPANSMLRGHEFHYSRLDAPLDAEARFVYLTRDREGREHPEGFIRGNTLASYIHLHFSSRPQAAQSLVAACARWSKNHCRRHDDKTDGYPPESSRPGH